MALPLAAMLPATKPAALLSLAGRLSDDGALGFLLSGGCGSDGVIHLEEFLATIRTIKNTTSLKINSHIGYPRRGMLSKLADTGIDSFSLTFPVNDRIGKRFFGLGDATARYHETSDGLRDLGAKVVPHMLIGLGEPEEDLNGIEILSSIEPKSLVIIAFTPLRETPLSEAPSTSEARILETLMHARLLMPGVNLTLGCMRPRGRIEMERRLIEETLDGIVMPSSAALKSLSTNVILEKHDGCCALYL